ncbi:unnamed protein product [Moneuplotes crassus]|uniref:Lysozyme n=1 Tax=Euplotes crassus TaxID=5936 RepID=A0A7S3NXB0_EUPCR|nr:unnamed protein product [Moneuplotes crassus]|mmetsp:Transcript_26750/g.26656  ORF Transcript_26750/g.26656 Transcript_26750/m.26656 type:complete len:265 (+) Transcript_26750:32-826(+)
MSTTTNLQLIVVLAGLLLAGIKLHQTYAIADVNEHPDNQSIYGIDVSHWQGVINWASVANYQYKGRKIGLVFMKATEGVNTVDSRYLENSKGVSQNLDVKVKGAYHYFHPKTSATGQADHFASMLSKDPYFDKAKDWIAIDVEDPNVLGEDSPYGMTKAEYAKTIKDFLDSMKAKGYVNQMIYGGTSYWESRIGSAGADLWKGRALWKARYRDPFENEQFWTTDLPTGAPAVSVWQFSDAGKIDGISGGSVDLNLISNHFPITL